jgi:MtrB/PioB family decaheme-associated outer membrane protein
VAATLAPAAGAAVIAGGGTSLQNVLQLPIALPPDNQAHQIYVSGNYRISPTTNGTFKYAYTHATQDDNFANAGLTNPPPGVTSLHGVVNSSLLQLGLNARPVPKLSMLANLRYEMVDDKTPEELYNVEAGTSVPATVPPNTNRFWKNLHINSTKVVGKLEASYQLPAALRATAGLDFSSYKRPVPVSITEEELAGLGAVRATNRETGYRLELRRTMSETVTGAIGYSKSKRTGGDWTSLSTSAAFAAAGLGYGQTGSASQFIALNAGNAFPMNMADIDRQKIKLSANWSPTELIDVQFSADDNRDKNATAFSEVAQGKGWRETGLKSYSVDASFAVSDNLKLTGYASQSHQNLKINHSTGYQADLNTRSDGFGFGASGNPSSKLEVGAQLTYLQDNTKYGLAAAPSSAAGAPPTATNLAQAALGLPDVRYHMTRLNLTGTYSLDKTASVRVSLIHQRTKLDEWSYSNNGVPYLFSDNTTVTLNPRQTVNVLGVMYIFKF